MDVYNNSDCLVPGVLLGNPSSRDKIFMAGVSSAAILNAVTPSKLAVNLLTVLFSHEELATGNCTKAVRSDINPQAIGGNIALYQVYNYTECYFCYKITGFFSGACPSSGDEHEQSLTITRGYFYANLPGNWVL